MDIFFFFFFTAERSDDLFQISEKRLSSMKKKLELKCFALRIKKLNYLFEKAKI